MSTPTDSQNTSQQSRCNLTTGAGTSSHGVLPQTALSQPRGKVPHGNHLRYPHEHWLWEGTSTSHIHGARAKTESHSNHAVTPQTAA